MRMNVVRWIIAMGIIVTSLLSSCSKSNDNNNQQPTAQKEYRLYNQSSGTPQNAGTFTISEMANGNTTLTINLAAAYRVANMRMSSNIFTTGVTGSEQVYAALSQVDGTTGAGITSPVVISSNNVAAKYTDLIAKKGFMIKVLNGGNVQAQGVIN